MALEPITRKEKIIAGENLEPITRLEKFLKEYGSSGSGGGGASSSDVLIIHATLSETGESAQFDKTPEQISTAYHSGKYCLVELMESVFLQILSVSASDAQTIVECAGLYFSVGAQGRVFGALFVTNDGVTWTLMQEGLTPMLHNVCFDELKIYSGGVTYTISVDSNGNVTATAAT